MITSVHFESLSASLEGELQYDQIHRIIYSTDASAYREKPLGVAYPKTSGDIQKIIQFAHQQHISLVPRAAGTSLAGQVVGNGLIVDVSKNMTQILELNEAEKWIRIQPGIVLDELNKYLEPYNLFFGPETSTSNRCMLGGMVGNNACGSHSILYGSTRDHLLAVKAILCDGSEVEFAALTANKFEKKCEGETLENKLYQSIAAILSKSENQTEIRRQYPDKRLHRRNSGYAIDLLLETEPFTSNTEPFNFCKIIAGSEGTLAFVTEIKLNLVPLPPKVKAVVAVHFNTLEEALKANLIALKYQPGAVELMDKTILDLTKGNIEQQKNRFFLQGEPEAILIIEFARETKEEIEDFLPKLEAEMRSLDFGFHFPVIWGKDISKIWNLRKSGLGVLSNMKGDAKPVSLVEDTAVYVEKLPEYIAEFKLLIQKYNLSCVYHAHIGSGELHLRPILDLKLTHDVDIFRSLALDVAHLVKKYKGSLSGEHGDGRLRGEFIPLMVGEHNYQLLKQIKQTWDPNGIFNPGKITDTPAMNTSLRYEVGKPTKEIETIFDFSNEMGMMRAVEKCNGAGDCRKTEIMGGIMCPSYMASRDEKNTTRARANILRDYLTHSGKKNPFDHKEIYEIMDLCLSCKGCKSECPSNVDMTKLKAEFLQHYYDANGIPLRSRLIANISKINKIGSLFPSLTNFFLGNTFFTSLLGFAKERKMPLLAKQTLSAWYKTNYKALVTNQKTKPTKSVYLFNDEFTDYNDTEIGITAIKLLVKLGYNVIIPKHLESGRTYLSKGLVRKVKQLAETNLHLLQNIVTAEIPLVGIEPSAILTFRDEYPELVGKSLKENALALAKNTFLIDEFLVREMNKNRIDKSLFTEKAKTIKLHCHCQQQSIASSASTISMLSFPQNYAVSEIPSGCCGMAGSFGYEKEHYELSQKIGELILFKAVRKLPAETLITAQGTSCRHQIKDGTNRQAFHPVEILYHALK
jgi:FAD/FMN-containing dehydrogenase/Fe-S oxidoreductase